MDFQHLVAVFRGKGQNVLVSIGAGGMEDTVWRGRGLRLPRCHWQCRLDLRYYVDGHETDVGKPMLGYSCARLGAGILFGGKFASWKLKTTEWANETDWNVSHTTVTPCAHGAWHFCFFSICEGDPRHGYCLRRVQHPER